MSLCKTLKATQPSGKRKLNDTRKTTQLPGVCQFDLFIARWVLVLWEEENTLSIVKETSIIAQFRGIPCSPDYLASHKKLYSLYRSTVTFAVGDKQYLHSIEHRYLRYSSDEEIHDAELQKVKSLLQKNGM